MIAPKAVLFDLYGTLIYEEPDSMTILRQLADIAGVDAEEYLAVRSSTMDRAMLGEYATTLDRTRDILLRLGKDDQALAGVLASEEERLRLEAVRLYPAALEVLAALRSLGLATGAVSNGTDMWRIFLDHLGLRPYFDAVAISCERGICKPQAELFLWVTGQLGVEPEECVYVGDGDSGEMEAARDLGMMAVLIDQRGGWARVTGTRVYYDRRITHLGELLRIVSGPT